jgi:hypothetical protein
VDASKVETGFMVCGVELYSSAQNIKSFNFVPFVGLMVNEDRSGQEKTQMALVTQLLGRQPDCAAVLRRRLGPPFRSFALKGLSHFEMNLGSRRHRQRQNLLQCTDGFVWQLEPIAEHTQVEMAISVVWPQSGCLSRLLESSLHVLAILQSQAETVVCLCPLGSE